MTTLHVDVPRLTGGSFEVTSSNGQISKQTMGDCDRYSITIMGGLSGYYARYTVQAVPGPGHEWVGTGSLASGTYSATSGQDGEVVSFLGQGSFQPFVDLTLKPVVGASTMEVSSTATLVVDGLVVSSPHLVTTNTVVRVRAPSAPAATVKVKPAANYLVTAWSNYTGFVTPAAVKQTLPSLRDLEQEYKATVTIAPVCTEYHAVTITPPANGTYSFSNVDVSTGLNDSPVLGSVATGPLYVKNESSLSWTATPAGGGWVFQGWTLGSPNAISDAMTLTGKFIQPYLDAETGNVVTASGATAIAADAETVGDKAAADTAGVSDADYIGQDVGRKHLLFRVPDYELSSSESGQSSSATWSASGSYKNSYIEIGDATDVSVGYSAIDGNDLLEDQINFVDDLRSRGATNAEAGGTFSGALATPPSETETRAPGLYSAQTATAGAGTGSNLQVTANIPSYVGWRDHTDGHRITTTRGDKIEIIGGNYKLVSLGRGTGVAAWDFSGGIMKDSGEDPGNTSSVSWVRCPTDISGGYGWKVVEQTHMGNNVERYHGTVREEAFGDKIISVTGAPQSVVDWSVAGMHSVGSPEEAQVGAQHAGDGKMEVYVGGTTPATGPVNLVPDMLPDFAATCAAHAPLTTYAYPTKWDVFCGVAPKLQQPAIYESTWAESVTEYTDVKADLTSYTVVHGGMREFSRVIGAVYTEEKYDSHPESIIHAPLGYTEEWHTGFGSGSRFEEYFYGGRFALHAGMSNEVVMGLKTETFIGGSLATSIGPSVEIKLYESEIAASVGKIVGALAEGLISSVVAGVSNTIVGANTTKAIATGAHIGLAWAGAKLTKAEKALNIQQG